MTIEVNWQRPFSEAAEALTSDLDYAITKVGSTAIVDITVTIGIEAKLVERIIITPMVSGSGLTHKVKHLIFPGTAASDYTSATDPANTVASNATTAGELVLPDSLNLDTYYTQAGVPRTDPTP